MSIVRKFMSTLNKAIPEVEKPARSPSLKEKLLWTGIVLLIYFFLTEVPVYGIPKGGLDFLAELRVIFAGARGSIVELGIGPVVTAGIVLELLVGSKIIELDFTDPEDRKFFQESQRVAAIFFIVFENAAYVLGGAYGNTLTASQQALAISQLALGSFLLMMLDDLVSKWGIGSGISLFILAGVAQRVLWGTLSPVIEKNSGRYVGVIPALITEGANAIYRPNLPDLLGLIATIVVFLAVVWSYEVKINVPIVHSMMGGQRTKYPIRLLYVSNVPIIFTAALLGDISIISKVIWARFGSNPEGWMKYVVEFFGKYEMSPSGFLIPTSGLAYYLQTPNGPTVLLIDPVRALVYTVIFVLASVAFAKIWVMTAGMDPKSVAEQLVKQGIVVPGRRSIPKVVGKTIERYIEAVTYLGGFAVGILAVLANFTGALGTGSGILLAVTIVASFYEAIARERALEMYPRLKRFFG